MLSKATKAVWGFLLDVAGAGILRGLVRYSFRSMLTKATKAVWGSHLGVAGAGILSPARHGTRATAGIAYHVGPLATSILGLKLLVYGSLSHKPLVYAAALIKPAWRILVA